MILVFICDGAHYFEKFITLLLDTKFGQDQYRVIPKYNNNEIDFLFFSTTGELNKKVRAKHRIIINGEPTPISKSTKFNICLDCKLVPHPNFMYIPFAYLSFFERRKNVINDLLLDKNIHSIMKEKTKFCAFLYSKNVPFRNALWKQISEYKKVDALGACGNPPGFKMDRRVYTEQVTYNDIAVEKFRPYKFVISCENTPLVGYCTEKIIHPMLANCIPIYYGDPQIGKFFNTDSFIHITDLKNVSTTILNVIKDLDQNDEKYIEKLKQPYFKDNKIPDEFKIEWYLDCLSYPSNVRNSRRIIGSKNK
jgi:hypothetical protein